MNREHRRSTSYGSSAGRAHAGTPGKRTLVEALTPGQVQAAARRGIAGPGGSLPHQAAIQASFGAHDVGGIRAHVGGAAAEGAREMGAVAYATGSDVAFAEPPDLHTAAHEAAHVVQQQGGVQLKGGVGAAGDPYERHADAVADRVVRGESAEALLGAPAGPSSSGDRAVQRSSTEKKEQGPETRDDYSGLLSDFTLKECTAEQASAFWDALKRDGETGHDDAFMLYTLLCEHVPGHAKATEPSAIREALSTVLAKGEEWDNLPQVQACVKYLNKVVAETAPQKADKASLYPGDSLLLASTPGLLELDADVSVAAEKAFADLRASLGTKLGEIAAFPLSAAMAAEDQISKMLLEVLTTVGELALAALSGDELPTMLFAQLHQCGFVDRLVYADLQMRTGKVLCHWTDTSIPLLECLNATKGAKFGLPKGQISTPIDESEFARLKKAALPGAKKAVSQFLK